MPRKLPRYVERNRDRSGKIRFYFRRDKKSSRIPLPADPASPEFMAAYGAALAGLPVMAAGNKGAQPGTIGALITSYKGGPEFRALRASTKATYLRRLEQISKEHGARSLAGMSRERIISKILYPLTDLPGRSYNTLKLLRVLIRHGLNMGMLKNDPTIGIKRAKLDEIRPWTEGEIAQFESRWPVGTKQRLAFGLMLYTGQRRSDVHRMTWADIEGGGIRVVQQKTGAPLRIALHSSLRALLAVAERSHVTILNTAHGKPFTVDGFSGFMRDAIKAAGLPLDCRPHGLRKTAGKMLAEAGCTTQQIMAVLGHRSLGEAERYTRGAAQAPLAAAAIDRLEQHNGNKFPQTPTGKFGEVGNRKGKST